MKRAVAILRKEKVLIQGYSKTTAGVWVGMGPVYVVDADRSDELGGKIREAMNGSTEGVQHPGQAEWKSIQAPMLESAGVKTWATLAKGAKSVGLELEGGVVRMVPSSGYANSGGKSLPEMAIECAFDGTELGSSLVRTFDLCD